MAAPPEEEGRPTTGRLSQLPEEEEADIWPDFIAPDDELIAPDDEDCIWPPDEPVIAPDDEECMPPEDDDTPIAPDELPTMSLPVDLFCPALEPCPTVPDGDVAGVAVFD